MEKLIKKFEEILMTEVYVIEVRDMFVESYDKAVDVCAEECRKVALDFSEWVIMHYPNQNKIIRNPELKGYYTMEELFNKFLEKVYK
jgi:hypothetical protein